MGSWLGQFRDGAETALACVPAQLPVPATRELPAISQEDAKGLVLRKAAPAGPAPKHNAEANERWRLLRLVADHQAAGECGSVAEACRHVYAFHREEFQAIARKIDTPEKIRRNHDNWLGLLGTHPNGRPNWDNVAALAPRYATGERGRFGDALFWEVVEKLLAGDNKISVARAYELARPAARRSGIEESEWPSLAQVRRWYKEHSPRVALAFAREGEEYAKQKLVGHIRRDWEQVPPNKAWFGDHHVFDAWVKIPDGAGGWKASRPWLTAWMDARSWVLVGWLIRCDSPNCEAIMEALRDGILRNGMRCAEVLYTDNGADYKKIGFGTPYQTEAGAALTCLSDLGTTGKNSEAYRARSKTVERMFGSMCGAFSKLWPSYLGNTPSARPDKTNYYWGHPEELPTLGQFVGAFREWLTADYHQRPNQGRILGGKSPAEVWTPGTGGPPLTIEALRLGLAIPCDTRVVGPGGTVRLDNVYYRSRLLWSRVGGKVVVRIDRVNHSAWACELDGRTICELELVPYVPALAEGPGERALLEQELAEQARHLRALRDAVRESTGGAVGLAPIEVLQIDWSKPYTLETRGSVSSVKGPGHTFKRIVARQGETHTGFALDGGGEVAGGLPEACGGVAGVLQGPRRTAAERAELAEAHAILVGSPAARQDDDDDFGPVSAGLFGDDTHDTGDDSWLDSTPI